MSTEVKLMNAPPEVKKAFDDYLELGAGRSIMALHRRYQELRRNDPTAFIPEVDSTDLQVWEMEYGWKLQAFEYDNVANDEYQKNRKEVLDVMLATKVEVADKIIEKAKRAIDAVKIEEMSAADA